MTTITRAPNGAAREVVDINTIQVPDLWHIAMWLKDNKPNIGHNHGQPLDEAVLECWHLCHDLIENIRKPELITR